MENALSRAGFVSHEPKRVDAALIERELAQLWRPTEGHEDEAPTTRAATANVIVFCRTEQQHEAVAQEMLTIVARHPSRVVTLVADPSSQSPELEVSVTTHCRLVDGRQQICSEDVTIRTGPPGLRRVPSMVRSLLLGDLPTTLWWASPEAPPLVGALLDELAGLANQVIYDSVAWSDPLRQLVVTAKWLAGERSQVVSDLAWRRPKLWRRLMAQSLDPACAPEALESITEVQVEHGPHALTQAWLLVGWLALRLGWQPRGGKVAPGPEVRWWFEWPHGQPQVLIRRRDDGAAEIKSLQIRSRVSGRPVTFRFHAQGPGRVSVLVDGLASRELTLSGPVASRGELVARQLLDLAPDQLFRQSVGLARTMAEAIL
ncbi:MAG: glucose-6-phosphate dehydrogenase assembly protein OpcA [Acidimicrobiia bacterium]